MTILRVFQRLAPIVELQVAGRLIRTTLEHPFRPVEGVWTPAGELELGQLLVTLQGAGVPVESLRATGEMATVYNLEVEDHHTYFVSGDDWGFAVWAHNAARQYSARGQREWFERERYTPDDSLMQPGGLRRTAVDTHNLLGNPIAQERSAIALAHVALPDGTNQIFGAGSSGRLTSEQFAFLRSKGVRLFGGDGHAELIIKANLPDGATVERWGISWGNGRTGTRSWNFPCGDCAPGVSAIKGAGIFE